MLATRCKYRNDSTSDSTGWPGELALQVQCRTTHAIKVSQRKRRSESNRFRYESMSEPEDRPPDTVRGPAPEPIFHWTLIDTTGRIPLPSCSAGHSGRSRIFAGYVLLLCAPRWRQPKQETTMNWDRVEGNWKQMKGKVQQQWGKLTNDDLNLVEGKRTELVGRIQERYGIQRDEAERQIDSWLRNLT